MLPPAGDCAPRPSPAPTPCSGSGGLLLRSSSIALYSQVPAALATRLRTHAMKDSGTLTQGHRGDIMLGSDQLRTSMPLAGSLQRRLGCGDVCGPFPGTEWSSGGKGPGTALLESTLDLSGTEVPWGNIVTSQLVQTVRCRWHEGQYLPPLP